MSEFRFILFDIESNGFKPSQIFMISMMDLITRETRSYVLDEVADALPILMNADMLTGHSIHGYDIPVIERLTDGLVRFDLTKTVDTLKMSKKYCDIPKHGLKNWGKMIGLPKLEQPIFEEYTPEMKVYCERDVELNAAVFDLLLEIMIEQNDGPFEGAYAVLNDYIAARLESCSSA